MQQKLSFRFAKRGSSVFYSHHDLMRHFARSLRRARLSPRLTDGFNPHPRMVFPHPLSLGAASVAEEIEIEFAQFEPAEEVFARLKQAAEPVVELTGWTVLQPVKRGRIVRESEYALTGWTAAGLRGGEQALRTAVKNLLARAEITVMRGHEKKARPLDIRPLLLAAAVTAELELTLSVRLLHSDTGTGRADEYARLLAQELGLDWAALTVTRVNMILA